MNRGNISFTFLDRVNEVELNIRDGRWQSALALALTIPDICGGIAFPEIIKRYRDGRMRLDRQKKPSRDVGSQYIRWFDDYAAPFFKLSPGDSRPYICGERCWQLRCEYLHQNKGFLNEEDDTSVRFHLGINCGTSVCQAENLAPSGDNTDVRIDIEQFCLRMCQAARDYYDKTCDEKSFSMYNTPVLDFIQLTREDRKPDSTIFIMSKMSSYAHGLKKSMESIFAEVLIFEAPEKARTHLEKGKPSMWVVTDEMTKQPDQPWRADKATPVILLSRAAAENGGIEKRPGRLKVLEMPVKPDELRAAVKRFI